MLSRQSYRLRDFQSLPVLCYCCFFGVHFTSACYLSFSFLFNKKLLTRDKRYLKKKVYSHRFVQLDCLCAFERTLYDTLCCSMTLSFNAAEDLEQSRDHFCKKKKKKIASDDHLSLVALDSPVLLSS